MANNIVNRNINIFVESGQAEAAYNRLIEKEKVLKQQLDKATDPKVIKNLKTELDKLSEPIGRAAKKMSGELKPSIVELQQSVKKLGDQLRKTSTTDSNFDKLALQLRQANIELAEAKNRASGLGKELSSGGGGFGAKIRGFGTNLLAGLGIGAGLAGGAAILGFLKSSVDEASAAEEASARLKATLDNLGKSDAFERLNSSATDFANTFKFLDNDDILGVFEQLITYGKLTEQQINELTPTIINFAAKQRISLSEAADVVIKALEGNGKALKTYGIDLQDAGSEIERYNLLQTVLKEKTEGAAEAFGKTFKGGAAEARQELANISEDLGNVLIPLLNSALGAVRDLFKETANVFKSDRLSKFQKFTYFLGNESAAKIANQEAEDKAKAQKADAEKARQSVVGNNSVLGLGGGLSNKSKEQLEKEKRAAEKAEQDRANAAKRAADKQRAERERLAAEFIKLTEEIAGKSAELQFYDAPQLTRDLNRANEYYDKLEERAQGNSETLKKIDELRNRENALIVQKYQDQEFERRKKLSEEEAKRQQQLDKDRIAKQLALQDELAQKLADKAQDQLGTKAAVLALKTMKAFGKDKLNAQIEELDMQEQVEIAAAKGNEEKIAEIRARYAFLRFQAERDFAKKRQDMIFGIIQDSLNTVSTVFDAISAKEDEQLAKDRAINEQKKKNLDIRLKKGLISQQEYNSQVSKLDEEQQKKEREIRLKQFRRDKAIKIASAIMNTAQGVIAQFSAGPAGFVLAALVAALGAIQIGVIAAQKPPEFAKGGYLPGPSHKEGGMPVTDPRTGRKVAEVEGGEVILSKSTVRNNPDLVGALLHSSMNRGGAPIRASWMNQSHSGLNVAGIRRSQQSVRMFESGGILPNGSDNSNMTDTLGNLTNAVDALNFRLNKGIKAYAVLTETEAAQIRLDNVRNAATIK